jgi:hypothetical protein
LGTQVYSKEENSNVLQTLSPFRSFCCSFHLTESCCLEERGLFAEAFVFSSFCLREKQQHMNLTKMFVVVL